MTFAFWTRKECWKESLHLIKYKLTLKKLEVFRKSRKIQREQLCFVEIVHKVIKRESDRGLRVHRDLFKALRDRGKA